MTQAQQSRLMMRVMANTRGGGGSALLCFLGEAVRTEAPNEPANERVTHCANTLQRLAELALAAAELLRDPDFIAENADVFDDSKWNERGDLRVA